MMKKDLKLQNGFWFSDLELLTIQSLTRGKLQSSVLLAININNKSRKITCNEFAAPKALILKWTGISDSSLRNVMKTLVDDGFLVKYEDGTYGWHLVNINAMVHKATETKESKTRAKKLDLKVFHKLMNRN